MARFPNPSVSTQFASNYTGLGLSQMGTCCGWTWTVTVALGWTSHDTMTGPYPSGVSTSGVPLGGPMGSGGAVTAPLHARPMTSKNSAIDRVC